MAVPSSDFIRRVVDKNSHDCFILNNYYAILKVTDFFVNGPPGKYFFILFIYPPGISNKTNFLPLQW